MVAEAEARDALGRAGRALEAGRPDAALAALQLACAHRPEDARAQLYRAWLRYHATRAGELGPREDPDAVRRACRLVMLHALRRSPRFDAGFVLVAGVFVLEGRWPEARAFFRRALVLNPQNAGAQAALRALPPG